MPGLNKVYLPRPRPVVLHVCASLVSLKGLEYGLVQGKLDVSLGLCYPVSQESLPSFIIDGKPIFTAARQAL